MKIYCLIFSLFLLILTSCNKTNVIVEQNVNLNDSIPKSSISETILEEDKNKIDIDLTEMSSTMVYSEVYNMVSSPDDYIGKTVRATGVFEVYSDMTTGKKYFSVIIADAAACCAQGIEFVWNGEHIYPEEYPEIGEEITVTGVFNTYIESEQTYISLFDSELEFYN